MRTFCPRVMFAHGINTPGRWQKLAAEVFSDAKIQHRTFDRYVSVPAFLLPRPRKRVIAEFHDWYSRQVGELQLDLSDPYQRPSVVAHSFGTWFVGQCMLKHPEVRFNKMILLGGILPTNFPWYELFLRDQVYGVTNECGWNDRWAGWVKMAVPGTGPSGRDGFRQRDVRGLADRSFQQFEHSDYFYKDHMAGWVKALSQAPLDLRIVHGVGIEEGYKEILNLTHEIDVTNFGGDAAFAQADLPRGLSMTWVAVNPDLYTFLVDHAGIPRAYINAMPLKADAYEAVKVGRLDDNEVGDSDVMPYFSGSELDIYLMSIGIDKTVRRENDGLFSRPLERLLHAFVGKLVRYVLDDGVRVRRLLAVGWTTHGEKLCQLLGMKATGGADKHGHAVYELDLRSTDTAGVKLPGVGRLVALMQSQAARGAPLRPVRAQ